MLVRNLTIFVAIAYCQSCLALKPEDVLGEYWKDPLFGQASSHHTVNIEILNGLLFPEEVFVPESETIRFVVTNKTNQLHLLAFSRAPTKLILSESFKEFVEDDVWHATMEPLHNGEHTHAETGLRNPRSLVKRADEEPTIIVRPNEFKEILVRFSPDTVMYFFNAMSESLANEYISTIYTREKNE